MRLQGCGCFDSVGFHLRALLCQRRLKRLLLGTEMCTHARRLVRLRLQLGFEMRTHARCLVRLHLQGRGPLGGLKRVLK